MKGDDDDENTDWSKFDLHCNKEISCDDGRKRVLIRSLASFIAVFHPYASLLMPLLSWALTRFFLLEVGLELLQELSLT